MPDQTPVVSVIIVSFNTRQMTLDCLRALHDSLVADNVPADVWLVDNASTDGSIPAIREAFPQTNIIANDHNAGFGAANNQAMRSATGEFFLLLNTDAFIKPGVIRRLLDGMSVNPKAAVIGPKLLNRDKSLQLSCYRYPSPLRAVWEHTLLTAMFPRHRVFGDFRAWSHDTGCAVDFVAGACMLVRRRAVDEVGMFDESFFMYAEETDWCYRFAKAGWEVRFEPAAEVIHLGGSSGKEQSDRVFCEFHSSQEQFIRKHHGAGGLFLFRLMYVFGSVARITIFGLMGRARPARRERCQALCRKWWKILKWTLGFRGPRLSAVRSKNMATIQSCAGV